MKTLTLAALTLCFTLIGCGESASGPDTDIMAATNKVEANVEGMTCSGCTGEVCTAVEQVAGVTGAHADLKTGLITVALADNADTQAAAKEIETLIAGLSKGKYKVSDVKTITADDAPATDEGDAGQTPSGEPAENNEQASTVDTVENILISPHAYKVAGMTCSGCSGEIEAAVQKIAGVKSITANHEAGAIVVAYENGIDEEAKTKEVKTLIAGLSDGKYTVQY